MFGLYSHFLKLWDHRNKHIKFEEVIRLENETLDEMLQRLSMECMEEAKRLNAAESGTEQFEEMVEISKNLSKNIPFVRVDLYQVDDQVYFSELTFHPCGGLTPFVNPEDDTVIGEMLKLPKKQNR